MAKNVHRKPGQEWRQAKKPAGWAFAKKLGVEHPTEDMVNHPSHYNSTSLECIDAIMAATDEGFEYYLQGNIIKYLWRYRYKNGMQDLEKAQWYLAKLIETEKSRADDSKS